MYRKGKESLGIIAFGDLHFLQREKGGEREVAINFQCAQHIGDVYLYSFHPCNNSLEYFFLNLCFTEEEAIAQRF